MIIKPSELKEIRIKDIRNNKAYCVGIPKEKISTLLEIIKLIRPKKLQKTLIQDETPIA